MPSTSTRLLLKSPLTTDPTTEYRIDTTDNNVILDNAGIYIEGVIGSRPAANAVAKGTVYRSTDTGAWDASDGTNWRPLIASAGAISISASELRGSTSYGLLTTPDRVTVTLPSNGLITVVYQAAWQGTDGTFTSGNAALFLGSNQVQIATGTALANADVATVAGPGIGTTDRPLTTTPQGLASVSTAGGYPGDATTGQVIGISGASPVGGPCHIFAAAGTYDVSVRFKSAGTVTASHRKLWVWARGA